MKYNLKYPSVSKMFTENKKFVRTVDYTTADGIKIGSVKTFYNPDSQNVTECFDAAGVLLDSDVENAVEGRQFIIDRYEYALSQEKTSFSRRVIEQMIETAEITEIRRRQEFGYGENIYQAGKDIAFLLNYFQ
jgi:hypothetical protein